MSCRKYQVTGFKWLKTLEQAGFGGILADDMGLGKTLQMIAVLLSSKQDGRTSLVVCPASLVYNWQEEVIRFAPTLRVTTITGTKKEREAILMDMEHYDVLITSYDLLKRDRGTRTGASITKFSMKRSMLKIHRRWPRRR